LDFFKTTTSSSRAGILLEYIIGINCLVTEMLVESIKMKELEPPSLLVVANFVEFVSGILKDEEYKSKQIYYHSTLDQK
jgi:hypothetical protein